MAPIIAEIGRGNCKHPATSPPARAPNFTQRDPTAWRRLLVMLAEKIATEATEATEDANWK